MGIGFNWGDDQEALKLDCDEVEQLCKYTKSH